MKEKIEYRKKIEKGYIGMNKFAAKSLHIPFKHNEHTIEIKKDLPKKVRVHTIRHEEAEEYYMKNKHYSYHQAHKKALEFEKLNKPFPKTHIKQKLKKMNFK